MRRFVVQVIRVACRPLCWVTRAMFRDIPALVGIGLRRPSGRTENSLSPTGGL